MRWRRRLKLTAVILSVIAYALLSHYSNTLASTRDLGVGLAIAPVLTVALLLVWRWTHLWAALSLAAVSVVILILSWSLLEKNFANVYLLQEGGFYALMAASFAQSLRGDRQALCTQVADKAHGPLTALEVMYTRRVTVAWAVFFCVMVGVTLSLYEFAPLRIWSLFANFCAIPLMALMFVGEYALRRHVLPQQRRSIFESVRVYFASPS
jgi:uncharacterized membrane protein